MATSFKKFNFIYEYDSQGFLIVIILPSFTNELSMGVTSDLKASYKNDV